MNIVVCVKQVPDTTAEKRLDANLRLDRASVDNIINPFDEYAIEEGLRLQEAHGGEVALLCMGTESAQETLRKGLAMGADRGVLVTDPALAGSDAWATSYVLAQALKRMSYDVILCGMQTTDSGTAQVPGGVAEFLGLPQLTWANKVEISDGKATIQRQSDAGHDVVEAPLPVVISVIKGINEPRYPSLKGIMQARRKELQIWSLGDLGISQGMVGVLGAKTKVLGYSRPAPRAKGQLIQEDSQTAATRIADFLVQAKVL